MPAEKPGASAAADHLPAAAAAQDPPLTLLCVTGHTKKPGRPAQRRSTVSDIGLLPTRTSQGCTSMDHWCHSPADLERGVWYGPWRRSSAPGVITRVQTSESLEASAEDLEPELRPEPPRMSQLRQAPTPPPALELPPLAAPRAQAGCPEGGPASDAPEPPASGAPAPPPARGKELPPLLPGVPIQTPTASPARSEKRVRLEFVLPCNSESSNAELEGKAWNSRSSTSSGLSPRKRSVTRVARSLFGSGPRSPRTAPTLRASICAGTLARKGLDFDGCDAAPSVQKRVTMRRHTLQDFPSATALPWPDSPTASSCSSRQEPRQCLSKHPGFLATPPRVPRASVGETFEALQRSVLGLHLRRVEELLEAGVSVNVPVCTVVNGTLEFSTLLHELCSLPAMEGGHAEPGSTDVMEALLRAKANVNPRTSTGQTPLMRACREKNLDAVRLLLEWHAQVDPVDDAGASCLDMAVALREELEVPATPRTPSASAWPRRRRRTAQLEDLSAELVSLLLDAQERIKANRRTCSRQLRLRQESNRIMTIDLDAGDNENWALGHSQLTPMARSYSTAPSLPMVAAVRLCARQGNHKAIQVLLEHGASPDFLNEAVENGAPEVVRALLRFRANPLAPDDDGISPIDMAVQRSAGDPTSQIILELLREAASHTDPSDDVTSTASGRQAKWSSKSNVSFARVSFLPKDDSRDPSVKLSNCSEVHPLSKKAAVQLCSKALLFLTCRGLVARKFSRCCRQLYESKVCQLASLALLMGALFMPDVWILMDQETDSILEVIISVIIAGYVVEFLVLVIAFQRKYIFTFFFIMDIVGACSLLLDLFHFSRMSPGGNAVLTRAARAAKLGARAGRFTKLVKLVRFLPHEQGPDQAETGAQTTKVMGKVLVAKMSSRVSCLIILFFIMVPIFADVSNFDEDHSMQMWAVQMAQLVDTNATSGEWQLMVQDTVDFYAGMPYSPFRIALLNRAQWEIEGPRRPDNVQQVTAGQVAVYFDFGHSRRAEATMDLVMIFAAIILMMGLAMAIASAVSSIVLDPLDAILADVRRTGGTIYRRVDSMNQDTRNWRNSLRSDIVSRRSIASCHRLEGEQDDSNFEIELLERVVRKLAALSEITMQRTRPQDTQTLQYLGQSAMVTESRCDVLTRSVTGCSESGNWQPLEALGMGLWSFNPLSLEALQRRDVCVAMLMVASRRVAVVPEQVLVAFVDGAASRYKQSPQYHNWCHAVDVTHTMSAMLASCSSRSQALFLRLEEFALLVAALCHDVGHPGLSNDFLVQTSHDLAIRYNDTSPLENMHCATLFELVKNVHMDILASFSREFQKEVRNICIESILSTDAVHHVRLVKDLQMFCEMNSELLEHVRQLVDRVGEDGAGCWPPPELSEATREVEARRMLCCCSLHLADISNPAKPFEVCRQWGHLILEEFFSQGERMAELGLPVPALLDRSKTNLPFSQISFIEFFAAPFFFAMVRLLVPLRCIEEEVLANAALWAEEWQKEVQPVQEEVQSVANRLHRLERAAPFRTSQQQQAAQQRSCSMGSARLFSANVFGSPSMSSESAGAPSGSGSSVHSSFSQPRVLRTSRSGVGM